jgi:hypothetical protein
MRITKLAALFCLLQFWLPMHAETRRAVLVGIKTYDPDTPTRRRLEQTPRGATPRLPAVSGDPTYWRFDDLKGPLNDVVLMEGIFRSFGIQDIVTLTEHDATADAILSALQKNFVDDARPGDVRIFYYSGHGNHIRNAGDTEHGQDQTIVPADNWRNTPDIRDKEIARILARAAAKGVKVTFIADSCHSGSLTRGVWNARGATRTSSGHRDRDGVTSRMLREPAVNDPGELDPTTHKLLDPEGLGVLTLAAAQSTEEAIEVKDDEGTWHGAFTLALAKALRSPTEPMDRVFLRLLTTLRAESIAQQPVMGGKDRSRLGIFGDPASETGGLAIAVASVNGKQVQLRGGPAVGIYPGCSLKSVRTPPVTVEITASLGAALSAARTVGSGAVRPDDLFLLDRWTVPAAAGLKVYIPPAAPAEIVRTTALEMAKLRKESSVRWLDDATAGTPTHVMHWNGSEWLLEPNPASAAPISLGPAPDAASARKLLPPDARFLFLLPPTPELAAAIPLGEPAHSAIAVQGPGRKETTAASAHYSFHGRIHGDAIEYAWLLPDSALNRAALSSQPLPMSSGWVPLSTTPQAIRAAGESLTESAERLARIRSWFGLRSPASQTSFPYHLTFKNIATGEFRTSGDFAAGEQYKVYLQADPASLKTSAGLAQRWVYVFFVDHTGDGTPVFPRRHQGNEGNLLPYTLNDSKPRFEPLIPVSGSLKFDFEISSPGIDTCFLLTTAEKIDDPEVFYFEGVGKAARGPAAFANPLTELLYGIGAGTRAAPKPLPAQWSIESLTIRSLAK